MIKNNLFCIITGETGSGKSTQIAQYIVDGLQLQDFPPLSSDEVHQRLGLDGNTKLLGLKESKDA